MPLGSVQVIGTTFLVVAVWALIGAMVSGCGYLTRRGLMLTRGGCPNQPLQPADFWIGLGALTMILVFWSLVLPVDRRAWIVPVVAGVVGVALAARSHRGEGRSIRSPLMVPFLLVSALLIANAALGPHAGYDLGLYQFRSIDFASRNGAVPGLANLHALLGFSDAHLVFAAFLDHGLLSSIGFRLANGLLVCALLVDVAWQVSRRSPGAIFSSFTLRIAVLLVPAAAAVVLGGGVARITGPDLDLAAFVLVAVGMLHLTGCVENGVRAAPALASTAALAVASATRPLYWPLTVTALVILVSCSRPSGRRRTSIALAFLPFGLLLGWLIRQSILSGYPLFPVTAIHAPVDWRLPGGVAQDTARWISSWAREPGKQPSEVLGSWAWLEPWLRIRARDWDVLVPLLLTAAAAPSLLLRSPEDRERRLRWRRPLAALVAPSLATLTIWFFAAPDPRFALAPLWLTAVAFAAYALPARPHSRRAPSVVLSHALVVGALAVGIGATAHRSGYRPTHSDRAGPFGTAPVPAPALVEYRTESGLVVWRPAVGDQCWRAFLCTPYPTGALRLRGKVLGDGFRSR